MNFLGQEQDCEERVALQLRLQLQLLLLAEGAEGGEAGQTLGPVRGGPQVAQRLEGAAMNFEQLLIHIRL